MLPKTKHIKVINQGLWVIKVFVLVLTVLVVQLTFGPSISSVLQLVVTWGSPIVYLIMNIIFVDYCYYVEFKINQKAQKSMISILLFVISIVTNIFSYYYNQSWISITNSIIMLIFLILTFLRISKNNSLFVYALNILHMNLITYSIHNQTNVQQQSDTQFKTMQHYYRILFAIFTLFAMLAQGGNQIRTPKSTVNQILALNTTKNEQTNRYVSSNKWLIYHVIIIIIIFIFPAVINYEQHSMKSDSGQFIQLGRIVWWASLPLIYFWSIILHKIYPQQDLSQLQNYFKQFQLN